MNSTDNDTIVAIATGAAAGGIGIVRLSGPDALRIAGQLSGRARLRERRATNVRFLDAARVPIDHGLVLAFAAPRSYTGEDVVELHAHGSRPVLETLLARCIALGARQARAGEFSERAYLSGKLDLAQAEAVADLIAAGSLAQARAALRSLEGEFSARVTRLQRECTQLRVLVEAALDFPGEDLELPQDLRVRAALEALGRDVASVLEAARRGRRVRDGLHCVIVGAPNTGKSSLLNALSGSERAIVTAIPGTTRDLLREQVRIEDIEITLVDSAGLRDTDDPIDAEGVRRAEAEAERADLALLVLDDRVVHAHAPKLPEALARIVVHNKCDLTEEAPRREARARAAATDTHVWLSARTHAGLDLLRTALLEFAAAPDASQGTFSARARHCAALERTADHLLAAAALQSAGAGSELIAEELRLAQRHLDELTGQHTSDALLGEIFSSFCIGK